MSKERLKEVIAALVWLKENDDELREKRRIIEDFLNIAKCKGLDSCTYDSLWYAVLHLEQYFEGMDDVSISVVKECLGIYDKNE